MGSGKRPRRLLVVSAAVLVVLSLVGGASAGDEQTGTLVLRLVTDPAPPGVGWTYSGLDVPFELGVTASERSITLTPGTYQVAERSTQAGQPSTLTALSCTDADGNTRVRIATASVVVGLEEGETVVCTFRHRALGRRSAAAALARAYAPLLRLSSGEPYRPLRIEDYLAGSSLRGGSPPRGTLLQPHPTLFSLPTASGRSYLDVAGGEPYSRPSPYPGLEQKLRSTRPRPTVYWHLVRDPGSGRVAIEYWLLYLYNDFSDKHEADWEGITVVLDGETPFGVSYSAHQGRRWSAWSEQSASATHPVVYVARGSHANYPHSGGYGVRVCWTLYGRHCTPTPKIDSATGTGGSLGPSTYDLQEFGGVAYSGNWGSGNYVLGIGLTRDQIIDPRRRSDYSNPFAVLGG